MKDPSEILIAQTLANRRGLSKISHEHPMWEYFLEDARAIIAAIDEAAEKASQAIEQERRNRS